MAEPAGERALPAWLRGVSALDRGIAHLEAAVLSLCLALLIGVAVYQAIVRNVLHQSAFWQDEVIRYAVFFVGLTGGALAAQADRLINIDIFSRKLHPRARLVVKTVSAVFVIVVCVLLIRGSLALRAVVASETQGEVIRPATGLLALPIAAALIALHSGLHALQYVGYLAYDVEPPPPPPPEGLA